MKQQCFITIQQKVTKSQLQLTLDQLRSYIESALDNIENNEPWNKPNNNEIINISDCPKKILLTLTDQLYIPIADLPGKLTAKLKHCAVFSNPEFYKRQALRLSTIGTSRYICSAHIENGFLILPRGCLAEVNRIVSEQAIEIEYTDKRFSGNQLEKIRFTGKLKGQQKRAVDALFAETNGVFVASTALVKPLRD